LSYTTALIGIEFLYRLLRTVRCDESSRRKDNS
jgi:hypothetical protein